MAETVLIVEDETTVRQTVEEWLKESDLDLEVFTAANDAEALEIAVKHPIDLAILDWNLGTGITGLDLLTDLASSFCPDIVAIMMTAYADQATPLDAMRRGVRDYLDKNQEFSQDKLIDSVRRQLEFIRPRKRERQISAGLVEFRKAIEQALPVIESLAALQDPVSLPEAIRTLFRFLINATHADDGVLFVRRYDAVNGGTELCRVYDAQGIPLEVALADFSTSIAAGAIGLQEPSVIVDLARLQEQGGIVLQPFEQGRFSLLAAPLAVAPGYHVVLELFDKRTADGNLDRHGFSPADVRLVRDAGEFGREILAHALAQRATHQVLHEAIEAAMQIGDRVSQSLDQPSSSKRREVLDAIREQLPATPTNVLEPKRSVELAEAIHQLTTRHGDRAAKYCLNMIRELARLLDQATGA